MASERSPLGKKGSTVEGSRIDLCCTRIAKLLLEDAQSLGVTRASLAGTLKVEVPTITNHANHLERASLVIKEKVLLSSGKRGWMYKSSPKLLAMEDLHDRVFLSQGHRGAIDLSVAEGQRNELADRPLATSPEFPAYLENIVKTSKTRGEAMSRLGYTSPTAIYRHLERLGIPRPKEWSRRPGVRLQRQSLIPVVLIPSIESKAWVGALIQGEGCVQCRYQKKMRSTGLQLDTSMVDPAPIRELAKNYGLPAPSKPTKNHEWKPLWRKNVAGLRAMRVLQEILPFLFGEKRREAEKAIEFFSPNGYHSGRFGNLDIWPRAEFPLRTKRRGSVERESSGDAL